MANVAPRTNRRHSVDYRNSRGQRQTARVLGPGSSSGLKLHVHRGPDLVVVDNVPLATSEKATNAYFNRR